MIGLPVLPKLIVVDREERKLEVYIWSLRKHRYYLRSTFDVTVGKIGHETPHGLYFVESKSRKPDWIMPPSSDYPEHLWGNLYRFGEEGNPFAGGFISLHGKVDGIGLHGTSFDPKLGTASSHGCVRMQTQDLLAIYDRCPIGTPVYLH